MTLSRHWLSARLQISKLQLFSRFASLRANPELLDEGPPFPGGGLYKRTERLRRLLLAWGNLEPEIDYPRSHRWIGERLHGRPIELADDVPWCAFGREKRIPSGIGKR